ncbi:MAG: MarC family protein [Gammaproteobacteria bacterium]|nr:MarC family protein [Gammaproteobacteria bacterium]
MYEFAINAFVILFVVTDPVGVAPVFAALCQGAPKNYARTMAIKGTAISGLILLFFMFGGHALLNALGISLDAFRIAGGFFLFLISIDMVMARQSGIRSTTPSEREEASHKDDISVFPLAIPLIAGPGTMTTLLLMMGEANGQVPYIFTILAVMISILLIVLLSLLTATRLMKLIGETGSNVVSRILGLLLAALAVQYMADGIIGSFSGAPLV